MRIGEIAEALVPASCPDRCLRRGCNIWYPDINVPVRVPRQFWRWYVQARNLPIAPKYCLANRRSRIEIRPMARIKVSQIEIEQDGSIAAAVNSRHNVAIRQRTLSNEGGIMPQVCYWGAKSRSQRVAGVITQHGGAGRKILFQVILESTVRDKILRGDLANHKRGAQKGDQRECNCQRRRPGHSAEHPLRRNYSRRKRASQHQSGFKATIRIGSGSRR